MAASHPSSLATAIRYISAAWRDDPRTDGELLSRFADARDESAFVAIVGRHGSIVWSVCRGGCDDATDAEDAFQATFMALARKAGTLAGREQIAPWLRITAGYAVKKLKRSAARFARIRRRVAERPVSDNAPEPASDTDIDSELRKIPLELGTAFRLYHIEGRTFAQVAEALSCSLATAQRRVVSARELLRERLTSRGVTSAGVVGGVVANVAPASAAPSEAFLIQASSLAAAFAQGPSPQTVAGTLAKYLVSPSIGLRWFAGLVAVFVAGGTVAALSMSPPVPPAPVPLPAQAPVAARATPAPVAPRPADLTTLVGQVRDETGRPVPGARVAALAHLARYGQGGIHDEVLTAVNADSEGKYSLSVPHFPTALDETRTVRLMATTSDGRTLGSVPVTLGDARAARDADVTVRTGRAVRGALVDTAGRPVRGAVVRIVFADGVLLAPGTGTLGADPSPSGWVATSGPDGRFELTGVPDDCKTQIGVEHPEHAFRVFRASDFGPVLRLELPEKRTLSGRVADPQGRPVAGARIVAVTAGTDGETVGYNVTSGPDGRFEFSAPDGAVLNVRVHPPTGAPLLAVNRTFEWPTGAETHALAFSLPTGVPVSGRVIEADSGEPVRFAQVRFVANAADIPAGSNVLSGCSAIVRADDAGRFTACVPPGRSELLADGASLAYVTESLGRSVVAFDGISRVLDSAQARAEVTAAAGGTVPEVTLALRRGTVLRARAVLPDGTPVPRAAVVARHLVNGLDLIRPIAVPVTNGEIAVPGCRPGYSYSLLIATDDFKHSAVVRVPCGDGPISTVALKPAGSVVYGLRDPAGVPAEGVPVILTVALDEEAPTDKPVPDGRTALPYDHIFAAVESAARPPGRKRTDKTGRVGFDGLIAGGRHHTWSLSGQTVVRYDFKPLPGETHEATFPEWGRFPKP